MRLASADSLLSTAPGHEHPPSTGTGVPATRAIGPNLNVTHGLLGLVGVSNAIPCLSPVGTASLAHGFLEAWGGAPHDETTHRAPGLVGPFLVPLVATGR